MELSTDNRSQQPSEQEQIAALQEQLMELRQQVFRLEGRAEALRQIASRPWLWSAVFFILGMMAIFFTFLLLLRR